MTAKPKTEFHNCKDEEELEAFLDKVEEGDPLEFQRTGFYYHWGLCVGQNTEGEVVIAHITAPPNTPWPFASAAAVGSGSKEESADSLANIGRPFIQTLRSVMAIQHSVRVNKAIDDHCPPDTLAVILDRVDRAIEVGGWGTYNFALNNCEHFVNYCRNGNHVSIQSLRKGRQACNLLAAGVRRIANIFPPDTTFAKGAAFAEAMLNGAQDYAADTERRYLGEGDNLLQLN